jgi:Tfp pilus assembly PilM family ATPase
MKSLKNMAGGWKKGPSDVVGLDIGTTGIKAVRMQKRETGITVLAAEVLPPVARGKDGTAVAAPVTAVNLPQHLRARHGCLTVTGETAVIKLLTFPGAFDSKAEEKLVENLGIEEPAKYRIGYKVIAEGSGRSESRVLTVAVPDEHARLAPQLFPSGAPVPHSIEVAGLASMTTLLRSLGEKHKGGAVASIDFGTGMSTFAIFNKGILALVRRFSFGSTAVLDKVREKLGVDTETAQGILMDGSFDISQHVAEVMEPLTKQIVVSRDFVERRENCRVTHVYLSGGLAACGGLIEELKSAIEVDVDRWDPFDGLTLAPGALPEPLAAQRWRFSSAVGACLGCLEEA